MTVFFHALRTVSAVTIGGTGHIHADHAPDPLDGSPRLIIDCPACEPYLHPAEWSTKPGDVQLTYDELRAVEEAEARQKVLTPAMAEIISRVVAESAGGRRAAPRQAPRPDVTPADPEEEAMVAALLAEVRRARSADDDANDREPALATEE